MTGVEVLNNILEQLKNESNIWNTALNSLADWKVSEIPDERKLDIAGAVISWSQRFDYIFLNGVISSNLKYVKLSKAPCSANISQPIKFIFGSTEVAYLYPDCIDWLDNVYSANYFVNNLNDLIIKNNITDIVHLDELINSTPFLCYDIQYETDAMYNALRLGYVSSLRSCTEWYIEPSTYPDSCILRKVIQPELLELFKVAMRTEDPFHQYVELYHLVEYKYYEGLYQKLSQLKSISSKLFYEELRKANGKFSEEQMFEFVLEELANGFTEILDIAGIRSCSHYLVVSGVTQTVTNLEVKFMSKFKNGLDATNKKTWCDFLYQLRCGIVHTKEGEEIFERTSSNESLLCNYILPFMIKLAIYLIEH